MAVGRKKYTPVFAAVFCRINSINFNTSLRVLLLCDDTFGNNNKYII